MTCQNCPTSPWAVPQNLNDNSVCKKVCCGREATYRDIKEKVK